MWTRTEAGKRMPVDPSPVEDGDFYLFRRADGAEAIHKHSKHKSAGRARLRGQALYKAHWASCPSADQQQRGEGVNERRFHEAASIYPMLGADELEKLAEDIAANGLREPIWLHPDDGTIIDGRNRFLACRKAGVEPRYRTWDGSGSLVAFALSLNLHRRHLDAGQRAMAAAKAKPMFEAEAKARQGARTDIQANLPEGKRGQARDHAARVMNVSPRSVESAARVLREGAPELVEAVESGRVAVSAAADLAEASHAEQREVVARSERDILAAAKEIRARKLEQRRQERTEKLAGIAKGNTPLLSVAQAFPILLADPPWRYEHAESESRAIENQYPTLSLDEICALPAHKVATSDAVLFLWATSPKLGEAFRVLESWGFTYRTCMVWDKERIGMGYWARQQHELLLIATLGTPPAPPPAARPASVVRSARSEKHSQKPSEVYEAIERMYPTLPKLELFARSPRGGLWAAWGNQVGPARVKLAVQGG